jgi:hypothetical protein
VPGAVVGEVLPYEFRTVPQLLFGTTVHEGHYELTVVPGMEVTLVLLQGTTTTAGQYNSHAEGLNMRNQ